MNNLTSLAASVRNGDVSAVTLTEKALAAVAAQDDQVHAFLTVLADDALARAAEVDANVARGIDPGPLAGVPVALKDNLCTRGIPTTSASKMLDNWRPPYDATVVTKLADAGAIAIGKTNLDEFAMGSSTENSAFGPTKNPLDLSRVPGGSSGGSAAAVAAGYVSLSLGSDTGGSIRQPAAFCGVVGLKPTYGLVSRYGLMAFASSLDQIGPFTTTVGDAALATSVIAGHDPMDSTCLTGAIPDYDQALGRGVEGLRVGLCAELFAGADPDVEAQVTRAAAHLEAMGATVIEVSIPEFALGLSAYYLIAPAEASSNLARYDGVRFGLRVDADDVTMMNVASRTAGFGPEVKRRIMLGTYALSSGYYDAYYGKAQRVRTRIIDALASAYSNVDVLLGATTPTVAFRFGDKTADPLSMYLSDLYTIPSNLAGHPAISVPFGTGADGLPVGVQVLAPMLREDLLFQVGAVLEAGGPK